jgi:tol-pal system-associated acyl-CoA thioesterase
VIHSHSVRIYYEDTDHSGLVYHANYLKYFERAREHLLGPERLVGLLRDEGLGFVVYRCELQFREGAVFGDDLEIRSTVQLESPYRAVFRQDVWRAGATAPLVLGTVHMVCVDRDRRLVPIPPAIIATIRQEG